MWNPTPWPGVEPAWEAWSLNHWTTRQVPELLFKSIFKGIWMTGQYAVVHSELSVSSRAVLVVLFFLILFWYFVHLCSLFTVEKPASFRWNLHILSSDSQPAHNEHKPAYTVPSQWGCSGMTKPVGETPPLENSLQKQSLAFGRGLGLPSGSDGKESAYNAGDLGSIPGLGRSAGEGNGYPLQYSCLHNPMNRENWLATVHGVTKSWAQLSD